MGWRNRSGTTRAEGSGREREEEMKKLLSTKKRIAMAAGLLVVAIGASAAFAYWTASGTGSGNATAGTDSGVKIQNVAFDGTLYPGTTVNVSFDILNNSSSTPVKVGKVVADQGTFDAVHSTYAWPAGIEIDSTHATAGCLVGDFVYTAPAAYNHEIAASGDYVVSAPDGGTLKMNDTSSNQDACKTATVTLHLKVDNSAI